MSDNQQSFKECAKKVMLTHGCNDSPLASQIEITTSNSSLLSRWTQKLQSKASSNRGFVPVGFLLIVLLLCGFGFYLKKTTTVLDLMGYEFMDLDYDWQKRAFLNEIGSEERIILLGDTNAPDEVVRWKALHLLDPTNPVFFFPYVRAYMEANNQTVSPEIIDFINRYDPNNGAYDLLHVKNGEPEIFETSRQPSSKSQDRHLLPPEATKYEIHDREAFDKMLSHIKAAYHKGKINPYLEELIEARKEIFPPVKSLDDRYETVITNLSPTRDLWMKYDACCRFIAAAVGEDVSNGKWESVKEWWVVSEWLMDQSLETNETLLASIVCFINISTQMVVFHDAVKTCPDQEFKAIVNKRYELFKSHYAELRDPDQRAAREEWYENKYGQYLGISEGSITRVLNSMVSYTELDTEVLVNESHVERTYTTKLIVNTLSLFIFTVLLIGIAVRWLCSSRGMKKLSLGVCSKVSKTHLVIACLLVVFPPLFLFAINQFLLSSEAHRFSIMSGEETYAPHIINLFLFLIFFVISSSFIAAKWLHSRELLKKNSFITLALCIIGIFTTHLTVPSIWSNGWVWVNQILLGLAFLTLLAPLCKLIRANSSERFTQCMTCVTIIPLLACSLLSLACVSWVLTYEERYYSELGEAHYPASNGITYFEHQVNEAFKKELKSLRRVSK